MIEYVLSSLRRASDNAHPWTLTPTEAGEVVAEVERLRAQRIIDNEALARAGDESRDAERAAVVAWLRDRAARRGFTVICPDELAWCADTIERGEHRKEETR